MKIQNFRRSILVGFSLAFTLSACSLPPFAQKARDDEGRRANPLEPETEVGPSASITSGGDSGAVRARSGQAPAASIYAVDQQTFRFNIKEEDVWDSALNALMRNYNVTLVDRTTGVITTEWDSYYLNQNVFRNKVSLRLRKVGRNQIEVVVHNNVEKLQDGTSAGTVGAVWLPGDDNQKETGRIIQNMAILLNQPPPSLLPGMIATDLDVHLNKR